MKAMLTANTQVIGDQAIPQDELDKVNGAKRIMDRVVDDRC